MEMPFTVEALGIFAEGNIIYKRDVDEAAFIERRFVVHTMEQKLILIAEGRHLSCLLDWRIFSLTEENIQLRAVFDHIINTGFTVAAGSRRSLAPQFRFMPYEIPDILVSVNHRAANSATVIFNLCEERNIGVKIRYNRKEKTFDLHFSTPTETNVVFSKEFLNVLEQDYIDDVERYRNVVYVGESFIHGDNVFTGWDRREISIGELREGQTATQAAQNILRQNSKVKRLSSTVDPLHQQFPYLKAWTLGSIVTSHSRELGINQREVVTEIQEIYDREGKSVIVNMNNI